MTNEEFAMNLKNHLIDWGWISVEDYIEHGNIIDCIEEYLNKNSLQVINIKNQLLGYSVENVHTWYNESSYKEKYPNAPSELTEKQAQYLLNLADILNANHDYGFSWEDIDAAINQWLSKGCVEYDF